jgi:hypothetical protein
MTWDQLDKELSFSLFVKDGELCDAPKNPELYHRMWKEWDKWCEENIRQPFALSAKCCTSKHQRCNGMSPFTNLLSVLNAEQNRTKKKGIESE